MNPPDHRLPEYQLPEYRLHGYRLRTDIDLAHAAPRTLPGGAGGAGGAGGPDGSGTVLQVLHGGVREIPPCAPEGELVAEYADADRNTFYSFARTGTGLVLRFHGAVEVVADPGLRAGVAYVQPGVSAGLLSVLLPGTLIATRLVLDGHLVLHASALATSAGALAFVGSSGMGKSTMAGLGLAAGLPLVSDDVLRVEAAAGAVQVWAGAGEVRLREAANGLADLVAGSTRHSVDGRLVLAPGLGPGAERPVPERLPLACCVIPQPRKDLTRLQVRRLGPFDALCRLTGFPRIVGWREQGSLGRQFALLADLCESVPVFEADVPWGPPFSVGTVPALLEALGLDLPGVNPPGMDVPGGGAADGVAAGPGRLGPGAPRRDIPAQVVR